MGLLLRVAKWSIDCFDVSPFAGQRRANGGQGNHLAAARARCPLFTLAPLEPGFARCWRYRLSIINGPYLVEAG